ncbi:MAG: DUF2019 domain-containing protein [Acidobacteria bacterium]|nr:DUF2019 domain-containing protein [Acidobacteriota bacterium]
MKIENETAAFAIFEEASIAHAKATAEVDCKTANAAHKKKAQVAAFLKERNQAQLLPIFLIHPDVGVRITAAARLISVMETEAVRVFETASTGSGIQRLNAEMVLSEWRKGTLRF